jgi:hypothetical protein
MWTKTCKCAAIRPPPCRQGAASTFYRTRGGGLLSCRTALSATYGGMDTVTEVMIVLANLAPGGCRGESYTRPGAASRVAAWELLVWSPSVRRLEGSVDGRPEDAQQRAWQCLVIPSFHSAGDGTSVPRMVAQWRGWRHKAGGDEGDVLHWSDVMVSP